MLLQGGEALQMAGVEPSLVLILQATMILFGLASLTFVRYSRQVSGGQKLKDIRPVGFNWRRILAGGYLP